MNSVLYILSKFAGDCVVVAMRRCSVALFIAVLAAFAEPATAQGVGINPPRGDQYLDAKIVKNDQRQHWFEDWLMGYFSGAATYANKTVLPYDHMKVVGRLLVICQSDPSRSFHQFAPMMFSEMVAGEYKPRPNR